MTQQHNIFAQHRSRLHHDNNRNLSRFLLQCQISGICKSPGRARFIFNAVAHFELCFLHSISYLFAKSDPVLQNKIVMSLKYGPPSGGGEGPALSLIHI